MIPILTLTKRILLIFCQTWRWSLITYITVIMRMLWLDTRMLNEQYEKLKYIVTKSQIFIWSIALKKVKKNMCEVQTQNVNFWHFLLYQEILNIFIYNLLQNILGEIKKSNKVSQYRETLISVFAHFLSASAKNLFLQKSLEDLVLTKIGKFRTTKIVQKVAFEPLMDFKQNHHGSWKYYKSCYL